MHMAYSGARYICETAKLQPVNITAATSSSTGLNEEGSRDICLWGFCLATRCINGPGPQ